MKVVNSEAIYEEENGVEKKYVKCDIYADTVPAPLPTPADIPGYDDSFDFYPGSTLYIITSPSFYMTGEDGEWYKQ